MIESCRLVCIEKFKSELVRLLPSLPCASNAFAFVAVHCETKRFVESALMRVVEDERYYYAGIWHVDRGLPGNTNSHNFGSLFSRHVSQCGPARA
jgi:hypothetical protein